MTIFSSSYNTTVTDGFNLKKTIEKLEDAKAMGGLSYVGDRMRVQACQGGTPASDAVDQFKHPIFFAEGESGTAVFDARPFGAVDKLQGGFRVRNAPEYDLLVMRAKLDYIWNTQPAVKLLTLHDLPMSMYASWLSETIGHKYTLDGEEQLRLAILAGWYYLGLFTNDVEPSESDRQRMAGHIARVVGAKAEEVFRITDELKILPNMHEFCKACYPVTGSVRLKEFNFGVLLTLMGGTWFGADRAELCGVAMEHPPTWIAMIYACFVSRTFKGTRIERLAQFKNTKGTGAEYMRSVAKLCSDYVGE